MRKRIPSRGVGVLLFAMALFAIGNVQSAFAETLVSPNYEASQLYFGASDTAEGCSGQYCARATIGNVDAGSSEVAASTAEFGPVTDPEEPSLDVIVDPGTSDLGVLDTETTASKTSIIRVRSYLSGGYVMQVTGSPPTYSGHALATSSTPTAATPGTEQFGINLADNTSPDIGATVAQVPSGEFSFGYVDPEYITANLFKYEEGDVVGRSDTESGRTDYTVSMIVNISNSTPAGRYQGDFSAVVIPLF